jgi:hypothetical protein
MDDLSGLDWSKPASTSKQSTANYTPTFAPLKPTPPPSGRATPLSQPAQASKPATPANDSFSNLVSFSGGNANAKLSLAEQQKKLAELKLGQQAGQSKTLQTQYSGGDEIWNTLGSGRSTPAHGGQINNGPHSGQVDNDDDDLFATFNKPQPQAQPHPQPRSSTKPAGEDAFEEDDDPFGLSQVKTTKTTRYETTNTGVDDDDVLGLLGQPVSSRPPPSPKEEELRPQSTAHPQDKAVAELVDMGFPAEKARQALETTDSGIDVQGAVGWLLNQAHSEARERSQAREQAANGHLAVSSSRRTRDERNEQRARQETFEDADGQGYRRHSQKQGGEKDPAQVGPTGNAGFQLR